MARIETLRSLALNSGHADLPVALHKKASVPYDAGATGRRNIGWNSSRVGQNTLLITNVEQIRARSREAIRNNAWATAAIDRFESNVISTGIQPHWQHPNVNLRDKIQKTWDLWCKRADYLGHSDFYSLQAIAAREVFEAGEVFARFRVRPKKDRLKVPLQIQLIEGEQLPLFLNMINAEPGSDNAVRMGIVMDPDMRRVSYKFYKEHPGEAMLYPASSMSYIDVPADQIQHVYKPLRAGQLRGEPRMVSVLALLYELEQYDDATVVKKKIQAMFAGIITKPAPEVDVMELATAVPQPSDPGVGITKMEAGTYQYLLPGESITFPSLPNESDLDTFMSWALHKFAAGCGLTFEQLTGNLQHVNYSSIRAGMLEFRRACEQFQFNVMVHQFCDPVACRWLDEAVLCGALDLPGYFDDPTIYQDITWVPPGWAWVDPLKESQAALNDVRSGFTSRTMVIRGRGYDPSIVDAQTVEERTRAANLGTVYDSDPNQVLIGRETQPTIEVDTDPDQEAADIADGDGATTGPSKNKGKPIAAPGSGVGPTAVPRRAVPKVIPAKPAPKNDDPKGFVQ